jgi:hypothetical protein
MAIKPQYPVIHSMPIRGTWSEYKVYESGTADTQPTSLASMTVASTSYHTGTVPSYLTVYYGSKVYVRARCEATGNVRVCLCAWDTSQANGEALYPTGTLATTAFKDANGYFVTNAISQDVGFRSHVHVFVYDNNTTGVVYVDVAEGS